MTKRLHQLALEIQNQLHGCALLHPADTWAHHAPRVQLDAWAALYAWHVAGEPITRLTDETEEAILASRLAPDFPLSTAPLTREALGIQTSERGNWIVIARVPGGTIIPVYGDISYGYRQPTLKYLSSTPSGNGYAAGYVNLEDQPTPSHLSLIPGTSSDPETEQQHALTAVDITHDDYLLTLAIHTLYR